MALAQLSRAAIAHGARLGLTDAGELATRLYRYNSIPASARWEARLVPDDLLADFDDGVRQAGGRWARRSSGHGGYWAVWGRDGAAATPVAFKLYVSPAPSAPRDAMRALARALPRTRAVSFKASTRLHGWLRPDKIVAHFRTHADLVEGARLVDRSLRGIPAHGVPLTAALGSSGILSWGVDLFRTPRDGGVEILSWRLGVAALLARGLLDTRAGIGTDAATRFALAELEGQGVDPQTFEPKFQ